MTFFSNKAVVKDIRQWTMPRLTVSETRSYVSFSAFDPASGEMKRKKIHLGRIKSKKQLRGVAGRMIKRLVERLSEGWNPWIEAENPLGFVGFEEVCDKYRDYMLRAYKNDDMREQTVASYSSYLHIFEEWGLGHGIRFCYQIERPKVAMFLDYVYVERNNSLRTRNGYLGWLKSFTHWLMDRSYLTTNPTEGFSKTKQAGRQEQAGASAGDGSRDWRAAGKGEPVVSVGVRRAVLLLRASEGDGAAEDREHQREGIDAVCEWRGVEEQEERHRDHSPACDEADARPRRAAEAC